LRTLVSRARNSAAKQRGAVWYPEFNKGKQKRRLEV